MKLERPTVYTLLEDLGYTFDLTGISKPIWMHLPKLSKYKQSVKKEIGSVCEGTLVSVWNAPIRGLKVYRAKLGGVAPEELPHNDKPVDVPPLPIFTTMFL